MGPSFFENSTGRIRLALRGVIPRAAELLGLLRGELGENGDSEAGFFVVVESPFDAELVLTEAVFWRAGRIDHAQPGIFEGELDAIAEAIVDIHVGYVADGLVGVQERHVAQIDFPIMISGSAGIVGVVWRPSLSKCRGAAETHARRRKNVPGPNPVRTAGIFTILRSMWTHSRKFPPAPLRLQSYLEISA